MKPALDVVIVRLQVPIVLFHNGDAVTKPLRYLVNRNPARHP